MFSALYFKQRYLPITGTLKSLKNNDLTCFINSHKKTKLLKSNLKAVMQHFVTGDNAVGRAWLCI